MEGVVRRRLRLGPPPLSLSSFLSCPCSLAFAQGNYFFKLSRYQKEIEALLHDESFVQPASRRNEVGDERSWGLRVGEDGGEG